MQSGPSHEGSACEFLPVICKKSSWGVSKNCSLIQKLCDILARDSKVYRNDDALKGEVIHNCEAFESSAVRQTV